MTSKAPADPRSETPAQPLPTRNEDSSSRAAAAPIAAHPSPESDNIDDAGEPWGDDFASA